MSQAVTLPEGFEELEPTASKWVRSSEFERQTKRLESSMEQHQEFYNAMMPWMEKISEHLRSAPPEGMDPATERLFRLVLALMETAYCVDMLQDTDSVQAIDYRRMNILHE